MGAIILSTSYAGTIRPDVEEQEYVDFGKKFFCVKRLIAINEDEKDPSFTAASCVILNKHWCITAGHVTLNEFTSIKVLVGNKVCCIDTLVLNKNFDPSKKVGDIALGFCKEGFGDDIKKPILKKSRVEIGDLCSIAGYGRYGNMETGAKISDYQMRAGSNTISYKYSDMVICDGSKENPTQLEFLPNIGDSGGGMFINGELAGITCLVLGKNGQANSKYGDEVGFVELHKYIEWIENHVKKTEM